MHRSSPKKTVAATVAGPFQITGVRVSRCLAASGHTHLMPTGSNATIPTARAARRTSKGYDQFLCTPALLTLR